MFGYCRRIQASTRFFPFMILIGQTLRLKANNYLQSKIAVMDDIVDVKTIVEQFIKKMKLVTNIHENVMFNVEQVQKKQKKAYATRKEKHIFEGSQENPW